MSEVREGRGRSEGRVGTGKDDLLDPFKLFGRMLVAGFRIAGYVVVSLVESAWYLAHLRPDRVGEAIGALGRGVTDAIADVFRD